MSIISHHLFQPPHSLIITPGVFSHFPNLFLRKWYLLLTSTCPFEISPVIVYLMPRPRPLHFISLHQHLPPHLLSNISYVLCKFFYNSTLSFSCFFFFLLLCELSWAFCVGHFQNGSVPSISKQTIEVDADGCNDNGDGDDYGYGKWQLKL